MPEPLDVAQTEQSFFDLATVPSQYDSKEVNWDAEGDGDDCIRRMFLEMVLSQSLTPEPGLRHLDLGCGTGWLSGYLAGEGVDSRGLDASAENIKAATHSYPRADFKFVDFVKEGIGDNYDFVTATMSFEHVASPRDVARKIYTSMSQKGRFLLIFGDYDYFTKPRFDVTVDLEDKGVEGEVSVRTNYGGDFGILYDVVRRPCIYDAAAQEAGFSSTTVIPFAVPEWLIEERPEYSVQADETMFQLLIAES